MVTRRLGERDIAAIARVHRRACLVAYAFMNWSHSEEEVRAWYAGKFSAWDWGLVAEVDGRAVGFIATCGAYVDQLFIDPDHQRRGIGTALLTAALERVPPAAALTVFKDNRPARRFYERHGFVEVRRFWNPDVNALEMIYARIGPSAA